MSRLSLLYAFGAAILGRHVVHGVAVWNQCGGIGYAGSTTCDGGTTCVFFNSCQPSSATVTSSTPRKTNTGANSVTCSGSLTKFKYFGVNEAGAEFSGYSWPGTLGTDYIWPSPSSIDYFVGKGFNTFRVPFLMERISPPSTGLTGPFDSTYLSGLKTKTDSKIIFDVMNEPHDIASTTVFQLNQAAINGIRASGATSQLILVEGTAYTGAWSWTTGSGNSDVFGSISDPHNNVAIEMHQYLDSDSSGTSDSCVSSTIGSERLAAATAWLKSHGLKGFLGETGGGSNDVCIAAIQGALCSMQQSGVWIGALWWAAGPWWGSYFQSIEPPSGPAISRILPEALIPFL
ncbi:glycoside hydrolase family 5 protein [Hydnum rufescens UP504]|uniref:cellulase n=1 Tax=Hydnum rufescens UP504 TaxID=1448309 RepID=A0A9P6E1U4_9AGAM|nr:glycoside hydrolase family 5 protein [Hydnum rufescens UP504]